MKRYRWFATARPRTALVVLFVFLVVLAFSGVFLPAPFSVAAGAFVGLACIAALVFLVLLMRGAHPLPPIDHPEERMASTRVAALISLFKSLENRKNPKQPKEPCHLVEQTEAAYQKEQAQWLAKVKQEREKKKGKPSVPSL